MKWASSLSGLLSLVTLVSAQADSGTFDDAETGITFQSFTNEVDVTYRLALPADASADKPYDVILQVVAPIEMGWVGWAWGGTMTYNPLTVVWVNGEEVVHSSRQALGYYTPIEYEDAKYTVLKGTGVNATHFKFTALCAGCASWPDFDGNPMTLDGAGLAAFAYAFSKTPVEEPASSGTQFSIHDSVGHWYHDLGAARSDKFGSWAKLAFDPRPRHVMAPSRKSKPARPAPPSRTLVLDNGAYTIKAGFVSADGAVDNPRAIPNSIVRDRHGKIYVASELAQCADFSEAVFRRPVEKGFIVNWEAQKEIWEREFFDDNSLQPCDPSETRLLLSEPSNSLPVLQANCDQMVFEEFGFASYYRALSASLNAYHNIQAIFPTQLVLLIDSGHSHTTVTPVFQGKPIHPAVRRLDVGGKLLTNYLARVLSLRHYDMRNEAHIVNEMKEAACYVSLDFKGDLERSWKGTRGERREPYLSGGGIAKDYVLPDFHTRSQGVVRDYDPAQASRAKRVAVGESSEDVLTLRNERFTIPEILFNPSDIGMRQPGIPELVLESLRCLPVGLWPGLLANILVVGGNSLLEGFTKRLHEEITKLVPDSCIVRVMRPPNPVTNTWLGGANLVRYGHLDSLAVTKLEYEEHGSAWLTRKFSAGLGP
ncbi:actin-domain-containing protein [Xylaria bambusicola]|uniref:actin-domain-containing protein n=1 Tax=Xylaria bambusicola TaxID=326684 RepID=UPI002007DCFA|nr:actin-domain-containing protein [Xylaria bambusicola]KAI0509763.1 actin-domain-containing protein [Xylaria bambusicola]